MAVYELEHTDRVIQTDQKSLEHALHFQEQHFWGADQTLLIGSGVQMPQARTWAELAVEELHKGTLEKPNPIKTTEADRFNILAGELGITSANPDIVREALMQKAEKTLRQDQNQVNANDSEVLDSYFQKNAQWLADHGNLDGYLQRKVNMSDPWDRWKAANELKEMTREMYRVPQGNDHELLRLLMHSISIDLYARMGLTPVLDLSSAEKK